MIAWHVQFCKDFIVFLSHISENNDNRHLAELSTRLIFDIARFLFVDRLRGADRGLPFNVKTAVYKKKSERCMRVCRYA